MGWLVAGRAVQGLGGGGLMILAQSIIADVVPARQRGRYLGVMGAVFGVSSVAGPLLGGWLTEGPGWRWALWVDVPLGLLAIVMAWRLLDLPVPSTHRPRFDVAGITAMVVTVTSVVLVTSWGGTTYGWSSPVILGLAAAALAGAVLFERIERRAPEPIIPLHLFRDRNFVLATVAGLILAVAMFGAIGYLPTYLQMAGGVDATVAGLLMLPMIGGLMATSLFAGQMVSRTGRYRWWPVASGVVAALGLLLLSTLEVSTPLWLLCAHLFVLGAGIGLGLQTLVLVVQNSFPASEVGTVTAANNFYREIGASIGTAVVGSLFAARLTAGLAERLPADALPAGADVSAITPELVRQLPEPVQAVIAAVYSGALTPIFLGLVPLALLVTGLVWFLREIPLADGASGSPDPDEGGDAAVEERVSAEEGDRVRDRTGQPVGPASDRGDAEDRQRAEPLAGP